MTPDDIDQIIAYHRAGKTAQEISALTGIDAANVALVIDDYSGTCPACDGPIERYTATKMSGTVMAERCVNCGRER